MFLNVISATKGFMYAAFVNQSTNFTICEGNVTVVQESLDSFTDQWGNITELVNMTTALGNIAEIMAASYPLTYSCYYGGTEAQSELIEYGVSIKDWKQLLFNVFSKMGPIYDTIYYFDAWSDKDLIDIQTDDEMHMYWYRMGAYVGILTSLLLSGPPEAKQSDSDGWLPIAETEDIGGEDDWR